MTKRDVLRLSHEALLLKWDEVLSRDSEQLSELLLVLGEVDARKLYLPAGYPSMYVYCVEAKHMSEDVAYKRIRTARAGRRFPVILREIAQGRLHLTGVAMMSKYLTPANADELLAAAVHKSRRQIETLLAERFPQPDFPSRVVSLAPSQQAEQIHSTPPVPGRVEMPMHVEFVAESPVPVSTEATPSRLVPLAPERFGFQTTISQSIRDKVSRAQELLAHQIAPNDLADLLDCLLDIALPVLEKRKFAATDRPQATRRPTHDPRHIPSAVKREVWKRDGGQCTFRSESGQRCSERSGLEFDHVDPVARGGAATVRNTRLLCHAHNQYEADKIFGFEFMNAKRGTATAWASG